MKTKLSAFLSFSASLFFTFMFAFVMYQVWVSPNGFGIFWLMPYLFSAAVYFVLAIFLLKNKINKKISLILFLLAIFWSAGPLLLFFIILTPLLFFTIDFGANWFIFAPVIFAFIPLKVMIKEFKNKKSEE